MMWVIQLFRQIVENRFGYKMDSEMCAFKLLANRTFRKVLKYLSKKVYMEWNWFDKPFSLRDCVFISYDGYRFTSFCREIFRVLMGDETEPLNEVKELVSGIAPRCVVLDIGAHIGMYTVRLADICREGRIVAVEPDPRNRVYLKANVALNRLRNVEIVPYAISDKSGEKVRFALATVSGHSRINKTIKDSEYYDYIYVETITLDDLVESIGLEKVDFIKIDVEGYEMHVLRGAEKIIRSYKPYMLIETFYENRKQVYEFLEKHGYKIALKKVFDIGENILAIYQ